jgi:ribosomal protein S26
MFARAGEEASRGRSKMNSGHNHNVNCPNCGKLLPRDKAISGFMIKNLVDTSSIKGVMEASICHYTELPKGDQKTSIVSRAQSIVESSESESGI